MYSQGTMEYTGTQAHWGVVHLAIGRDDTNVVCATCNVLDLARQSAMPTAEERHLDRWARLRAECAQRHACTVPPVGERHLVRHRMRDCVSVPELPPQPFAPCEPANDREASCFTTCSMQRDQAAMTACTEGTHRAGWMIGPRGRKRSGRYSSPASVMHADISPPAAICRTFFACNAYAVRRLSCSLRCALCGA